MIEVKNIHKRYSDVEVLRGVSLSVSEAMVTAIVGPSGAGKSTLLNIMGTLESADSGQVLYDGVDVLKMGDNALSRFRGENIGFVFQFHRLLPEFSLLENVALPGLIAGKPRRETMERARMLIESMGLADRMSHRPQQMSGGECQRASVARALINKPSVVLADEPSGSLDSANRRELHRLFFDLRDKFGTTFVIVTHDEGLAGECDNVIRLADGVIDTSTDHKPNK